jgi:hypothetical protein
MLIIPRKKYRGFSLMEVIVVMIILTPFINGGTKAVRDYTIRQSGIEESRQLTDVARAASTLALKNLTNHINNDVGVGSIQITSIADLIAEGVYSDTAPSVTALRRNIQVIYYAPSADKLIVLAHAFTPADETTPKYVPRGGDNIRAIGYVSPVAPTRLRGPGVDYDMTELLTLAGTNAPTTGDVVAIDVLSINNDVLPYLHRVAIPGRPELNKMETDLDMGGYSISNADAVLVTDVNASGSILTNTITGSLRVVGDATFDGSVTINGNATAANMDVEGALDSSSIVTSRAYIDTLQTRSLATTMSLSVGGVLSVGGEIQAPFFSGSTVEFKNLKAGTINAQSVGANSVNTNQLNSGPTTINNLTVGSCTGC